MKLKKKILITGAFGFIGSFFYKKIIKLKNLEIYTTTNRENLLKKKNSFRNFRIKKNFKIDLANKKKVKLLLNKIK
jgi:FlaA1/EpsC-like NDP-sugar epimerase